MIFFRIPYVDDHTILVYFMKLGIILLGATLYVYLMPVALTFMMNCYSLLKVGFVHIKSIFKKIDELAMKEKSESNLKEMKLKMVTLIELHIRLLE